MRRCVNWQGLPSGDQPSTRIGMCKWPTFFGSRMPLVNARSASSLVIGRHRAPTICPDDMSFSSRSDDLTFFESQSLGSKLGGWPGWSSFLQRVNRQDALWPASYSIGISRATPVVSCRLGH